MPEKFELELIRIPAGKIRLGSPSSEAGRQSNENQSVEISISEFYMGQYPVSQQQWRLVSELPQVNISLNASPSKFSGDNLPVEQVNWHEAVEFCDRLQAKTGKAYRLPSEAEWEYACRAGTTTPFHFGETITSELVNYNGNSSYAEAPEGEYREQTTDVGSFPPNAYGLYDVHGNVWEWCLDHKHDNYYGAPIDGSAWVTGGDSGRRILRGGSWSNDPRFCRSAYRGINDPVIRSSLIGFRVSCSSPRSLQ